MFTPFADSPSGAYSHRHCLVTFNLSQLLFLADVILCIGRSVPDVERDRDDGVENDGVGQEDKHGGHRTTHGHTLILSTATDDASWNEVFPRQIQLEPMTNE